MLIFQQVYFCDFIIKPYLEDPAHSKYIDPKVLDKYWNVGGIRLVGCQCAGDAAER